MMKVVTVLAIVACMSISCTKTFNPPQQVADANERSTNTVSSPLEKKFVVNGTDTVLLRMVMEPAVVCYSYGRGEAPKPCDIWIDFTCTLSKPIGAYVMVDVQKTNTTGVTDPGLEGSETEAGIVFNIAPNTTKFT
ncbi:MAG: hypothetical protein ABI581_13715, partial [Sediminibacterium sp.]